MKEIEERRQYLEEMKRMKQATPALVAEVNRDISLVRNSGGEAQGRCTPGARFARCRGSFFFPAFLRLAPADPPPGRAGQAGQAQQGGRGTLNAEDVHLFGQ